MEPNFLLKTAIFLSLFLIAIVVGVYIINFYNFPISKNSQTWGTFGDYFGGILNPIIGILNLGALIYITFQIASNEEQRNINGLSNQKQFALYSLKHDSLKELNKILEKVQPELVKSDDQSELNLIFIRNDLNAYINTNSYLFPSLNKKHWTPIIESMDKLAKISGEYYLSKHTLDIDTEIKPEMLTFNDLKIEIINMISSQIIE